MSAAGIDGGLYLDFTRLANDTHWLNGSVNLYTTVGLALMCGLLALAWWRARPQLDNPWVRAASVGIGMAVAIGANSLVKDLIAERRPCLTMPHAYTVISCPGPSDYSFPSNHSALAGALVVGIFLFSRKLGLIGLALALAEGFSRIYLGVHYPHDVLVGLLLGAGVTAIAVRLISPLTIILLERSHQTTR
ncbi:MAG: phosphatase PAP2 family protein [Actinocrinis sp.]